MTRRNHPFLPTLLLLAIGLRALVGAPCCMALPGVESGSHGAHAHHAAQTAIHAEPGEPAASDDESPSDPSANPCCSACSPPLPSHPPEFAARSVPRSVPEPTPVRALATRPPFPAYDARGPPVAV